MANEPKAWSVSEVIDELLELGVKMKAGRRSAIAAAIGYLRDVERLEQHAGRLVEPEPTRRAYVSQFVGICSACGAVTSPVPMREIAVRFMRLHEAHSAGSVELHVCDTLEVRLPITPP